MNTTACRDRTRRETQYDNMPVIELIKLISEESDRSALREFHDHRRLFCYNSSRSMLLTEFIDLLCSSTWALGLAGHNYNLLEKTYEQLIDRFSNIPDDNYPHGPDCRYYFNAFLATVHRLFEKKQIDNPLQKELLGAKTLQNMVVHHFKYCLKESSRRLNPLRTRYQWHTGGGIITVWMPVSINGNERKAWLEEHVVDLDPDNPAEKYRLQQIIDSELGMPFIGDFEYCRQSLFNRSDESSLPVEKDIDVKGLAGAVADEKIENIDSMRPAIKSLGKEKLSELIHCIFHDISYESYEEKSIAQKFGLSRSTLSRFAGSRWNISAFQRCPDLWGNLAGVLAANTVFTQAARECGVWEKVLKTIEIKG